MLGARPPVLQGGNADGGGPLRAGVGAHRPALRDRAGGQRQATRCTRTTAASADAGGTVTGETTSVPARAAGGGVDEEPARCSHRLALRNWVALTRYTEDGRLKIDNNGA